MRWFQVSETYTTPLASMARQPVRRTCGYRGETAELGDVFALFVEDHDALVTRVGHEHASLAIHGQGARPQKDSCVSACPKRPQDRTKSPLGVNFWMRWFQVSETKTDPSVPRAMPQGSLNEPPGTFCPSPKTPHTLIGLPSGARCWMRLIARVGHEEGAIRGDRQVTRRLELAGFFPVHPDRPIGGKGDVVFLVRVGHVSSGAATVRIPRSSRRCPCAGRAAYGRRDSSC